MAKARASVSAAGKPAGAFMEPDGALRLAPLRCPPRGLSRLGATRRRSRRARRRVALAHRRDRLRVPGLDLVEARHREAQVFEQAVPQAVEPAVHDELLAARPGVADDRRLADVA